MINNKTATRKDVAISANVSETAVSRYVNDSGYLSEEKRVRIKTAIEELNYRPNILARSLKTSNSKQLVFICNEITNLFYSEIAIAMTDQAKSKDYIVMLCNSTDDEDYILKICSYMVSGVFISTGKVSVSTINKISDMNIPVVVLNNLDDKLNKNISKIYTNSESVVSRIVDILERTQRKNVMYVSKDTHKKYSIRVGKSEILFDEIQKRNLPLPQIIDCDEENLPTSAYNEVINVFKNSTTPPDMLICLNDIIAMSSLKAVVSLGLRVPEDVMIIGSDNTILSSMSSPEITSIDTKPKAIGEVAVNMLINKCNGKKVRDVNLDLSLIERKSTAY